ncbi:flavin reductase family protein [Streptomyces sp. JW3]|uniref:flavin reductase family protein n=1 Tax=Streptomyces sp. JW3 TaxID=3456955 RepID=UPI003FA46247
MSELTARQSRQRTRAVPDGLTEPGEARPGGEWADPSDGSSFRRTMSRFATCVTVTTAATPQGPVGCTTTAVLSLSADPPALLVSLSTAGRTCAKLLSAGAFAVNVLSEEQPDLVGRFATGDPYERFAGVPYVRRHGVPVLAEASASVVCAVRETVPVLDHTLLIGTVQSLSTGPCRPLVLLDHRLHTLALADGVPPSGGRRPEEDG